MTSSIRKRLQVFVSSTYEDLKSERQAAVEAILVAGHIPAGMELFTAGDQSQTDVINQWIDESDVYLLILGGRYGTIDKKSGKSYIHLEYEYALRKGKPLFSLAATEAAIDAKVKGPLGKRALENAHPQQLEQFREIALSHIVRFWDDEKDIKIAIGETLSKFSYRNDLTGWIRSTQQVDIPVLTDEIARLSKENAELRKRDLGPANQTLLETDYIARRTLTLVHEPSIQATTFQDAICAWRLNRAMDDTKRILNHKWPQEARSSSVQVNFLFVSVMNLLLPGDRYDTITNMDFWQADAIDDTRFLDANIDAVRRGAHIRRVFIIDHHKLQNPVTAGQYQDILSQHRVAEKRANEYGGQGTLTTHVLYAQDFRALRKKYGHFGIAYRSIIGHDYPDALVIEPIYRGGNGAVGIAELEFLFPKPKQPESERLDELRHNFA